MRGIDVWVLAAVFGVPTLASCSRCGGGSTSSATGSASTSASAAGSTATRCTALGAPARFGIDAQTIVAKDESPVPFAAEIGGASADAEGFFVGARAPGLTGSTVVLHLDASGAALRTLVTTPPPEKGVARAPFVATSGGKTFVATLLVEEGSKRTLDVAELNGAALSRIGLVPQGLDESEDSTMLSFGAAPVVSWDDADAAGSIGRVRLVRVSSGMSVPLVPAPIPAPSAAPSTSTSTSASPPPPPEAAPPDVLSPSTSDASFPLLVAGPNGKAALFWLAERPESEAALAAQLGEADAGEPSQVEAHRWVEVVIIDPKTGRALGPPRALTSKDGHAQTMAAVWTGAGLVVVVRDDARPTDGDGGALVASRAPVDAAFTIGEPTTVTIAASDVAPGMPFVSASESGVVVLYLDGQDGGRLVGVFGDVRATREPALDDRHVIAATADRFLTSRLAGRGLELLVLRCAP